MLRDSYAWPPERPSLHQDFNESVAKALCTQQYELGRAGTVRIALYSDLHLEKTQSSMWCPEPLDVDVVILAGDIGRHTGGLDWASTTIRASAAFPEIVYVAGNHEYHGAHLGLLDDLRMPNWQRPSVHFLEMDIFEFSGVRFLGCTLWSDFGSQYSHDATNAMNNARLGVDDYRQITNRTGERLEPRDTLSLHRKAVNWLDAELSKPFAGKTVVITHFAPHERCIAREYPRNHELLCSVTNLSSLMEKHRIDLWCHGHTHRNNDFIAENGCRVIANQRGYPSEITAGRMGFRDDLVIELDTPRCH